MSDESFTSEVYRRIQMLDCVLNKYVIAIKPVGTISMTMKASILLYKLRTNNRRCRAC